MSSVRRIYLDNASTTRIDPAVLDFMLPYLGDFYGNPSSLHAEGLIAKKAINQSRLKIAEIIGADKSEIIFTSGGTESDNLAIIGIARANQNRGRHIITSSIEHKAILDSCKSLESDGFEVTYLGVDSDGLVSVQELSDSLRPDTILVSIMYANNEIGSIQPISELSSVVKKYSSDIIFHTDACQASGSLDLDVAKLGVDSMTISSSKIYGPKGVGCLCVRSDVKIEPILLGGGQERGLRSGTENVAGIVGFAEALSLSENKRISEFKRLTELRDYFIETVISKIDGVTINGGLKNRLSNNINFSIRGVEGESLVLYLDNLGIACSTGSACSSMDLNPSHVLLAIGVPLALAHCSVRFTLGRYINKDDVDYTINRLIECVDKIRNMSSIR